MNILIGLGVALVFFVIVYKIIKPAQKKAGKDNHFICDVCKGNVCECRPDTDGD
jgi:hypothetical protein